MLGSGHYFFHLLATVMSKIVVITTGLPATSELIEIGYAAMGVPITLVVYLWNDVHTPLGRGNFGLKAVDLSYAQTNLPTKQRVFNDAVPWFHLGLQRHQKIISGFLHIT